MTDNGAEELAQPQPRWTAHMLRMGLVLGVAVLLGILLVTRHYRDAGVADPARTPPPTGSSSPSSVPSGLEERLAVYPMPDRQSANVARCPAGFDCPISHRATAGTRAALEAAFPGAHVVAARTVRAVVAGYGQTVWTIDVTARVGDEMVQLRVQPASPTDRAVHGTILFGGHALTHWESMLSEVVVVIDVVAPADSASPLAALDQLAHDARLTSPW